MTIEISASDGFGCLMENDVRMSARHDVAFIEYDFDEGLITLYDNDHNGISMCSLTECRIQILKDYLMTKL